MYEPLNLQRWTHPKCYAGEVWPNWYVFLGQNRDSDSLTRSNFTCALEELGGESETVRVIRESHWAVGWVEWIGIHQDDEASLEKADKIAAALADYPVVNETHWSELEWEEAQEYWESISVRERADICKRFNVSIFAARHNSIPQDGTGAILDYLRS